MKRLLFVIGLMLSCACLKNPTVETPASDASDFIGTVSVEYEGEIVDNPDIRVRYVRPEGDAPGEIVIYRIKFVPKMPVKVDVTIPGVGEEPGGTEGEASLVCPDVNPLALGGEEPKYRVSGFSGKLSGNRLEFSLMFGPYPTYFVGER